MAEFQLQRNLPSSDELPCSDDTPVDNEDQNFLPNFLLFLLDFIWANRQDWYFGVDMGIYHTTGVSPLVPVVPDGFLSLGVERRKAGKSRLSYVVWEENNIPPIFVLEIVSRTPGNEYDLKTNIYANLGVLYYVIYNPDYWRRDGHLPFEVYRLVNGSYQLQIGEPLWMPEIGLGIGRYRRFIGGVERELLYWCDRQGNRYLAADEAEEQARQRAERLAARLRELGEDPQE
ncbi:Uma2 family endonuclease [Chlorogloeopsis sp. ULAP01]|uniref:Uma2 family endonuclease n=1 Tax=Chlorogloeopsis sp. ULAP01 TaxID=3056483 RepID=UPI0025AB5435|nr:Uma2 family endonuclease [Chlorogloeopsis sp. ULAP01]MDM9383850.1 Uma2 family endonuclease [Chlorogloeopsis sp. ULAP01]